MFVVKDNRVYNIKFGTSTLKAPESLPVAQKIIDTIKITSSQGGLPKTTTPLFTPKPISPLFTPKPISPSLPKPMTPPSESSPPEDIPGIP